MSQFDDLLGSLSEGVKKVLRFSSNQDRDRTRVDLYKAKKFYDDGMYFLVPDYEVQKLRWIPSKVFCEVTVYFEPKKKTIKFEVLDG